MGKSGRQRGRSILILYRFTLVHFFMRHRQMTRIASIHTKRREKQQTCGYDKKRYHYQSTRQPPTFGLSICNLNCSVFSKYWKMRTSTAPHRKMTVPSSFQVFFSPFLPIKIYFFSRFRFFFFGCSVERKKNEMQTVLKKVDARTRIWPPPPLPLFTTEHRHKRKSNVDQHLEGTLKSLKPDSILLLRAE